jgi:predicted XRE-type DNA-binding protein
LKQVDVAKLLGVTQPDVSQMLHGYFRQFSVERLLRFLVALGPDVQIVIKAHPGSCVHRSWELGVTGGGNQIT